MSPSLKVGKSLTRTIATHVRSAQTVSAMPKSYPLVKGPELERISIRPWLDFSPPPQHLLSNIPTPPNAPNNVAGFNVSTHVIPASYLRHTPLVTPPPPPSGSTKDERLNSATKIRDEMTEVRIHAWEGKLESSRQAVLWNCINRYVPIKENKGGVTLLFAHANGFPKEIWEPMLEYLADSEHVEEVWTWEATQHGDSALLNREQESAVYNWADNSNDVLNFLVNYLPPSCSHSPLPIHLERLSDSQIASRKLHGFKARTFVGIGHSFGGCTLALSALRHPALFSSLVLADPVITQHHAFLGLFETATREILIRGAIQRRTEWSSRDEALKTFTANPFFATWHPSVLQAYVQRGIYLDSKGGITRARLKTTGIQEAACFMDSLTAKEVYQEIERLSEEIALMWVMPGKEEAYPIGGAGAAEMLVWRRPTNSTNVIVPDAGHLIPQESPQEFALVIADFLSRTFGVGSRISKWKAKL